MDIQSGLRLELNNIALFGQRKLLLHAADSKDLRRDASDFDIRMLWNNKNESVGSFNELCHILGLNYASYRLYSVLNFLQVSKGEMRQLYCLTL